MADETYPQDLRYYREHDWVRVDGDDAIFGITWFAQDALGEIVYAEPPEVGARSRPTPPTERSSRSRRSATCTRH